MRIQVVTRSSLIPFLGKVSDPKWLVAGRCRCLLQVTLLVHTGCQQHPNSWSCAHAALLSADIAFDVTQYTVTPEYYTNGGCRSHLYRLVVDLPSRTISSCTQLLRRTVEFPALNTCSSTGRPYRHAYFAGDAVDHPKAWGPAQVGWRRGAVDMVHLLGVASGRSTDTRV
jgi:hypothetical protein